MKKYYNLLLIGLLIFVNACGTNSNYVYMIDRNPAPVGQANHLVLNPWIGDYGIVSCSLNKNGHDLKFYYDQEHFRTENGSKKWIVANWGQPDFIEKSGNITFYNYTKKNRGAPNYKKQFIFGERPVKLGFRGDRLVEIQAYFSDRGYKGQKVVILNP